MQNYFLAKLNERKQRRWTNGRYHILSKFFVDRINRAHRIGVAGSYASLSSEKENKTILERFGYTVGTEIGSGSYAKVKVNKSILCPHTICFVCRDYI